MRTLQLWFVSYPMTYQEAICIKYMLQLPEHNYLVVIISLVFVIFLKAAILKMAHIT